MYPNKYKWLQQPNTERATPIPLHQSDLSPQPTHVNHSEQTMAMIATKSRQTHPLKEVEHNREVERQQKVLLVHGAKFRKKIIRPLEWFTSLNKNKSPCHTKRLFFLYRQSIIPNIYILMERGKSVRLWEKTETMCLPTFEWPLKQMMNMPVRIEKIKSIFSWGGGGWWLVFVEELPGQITRRHLTSVSFRTPHVSLAIQPGRRNNPLKMPFPSTEQKGKRKKTKEQ